VGSCYALDHPGKVAAYVGVGQLVSAEGGEALSYEHAQQCALKAGDDISSIIKAYRIYLVKRTTESLLELRSLTSKYNTSEKADNNSLWLTVKSPYFGFYDLKWALKGNFNTKEFLSLYGKLFDYAMKVDVKDYGMEYKVPVGFILGAQDWTTPVECTKEYHDSIKAPEKKMELINGCGHYPQYEDTDVFCRTLKNMLDSFLSQDQ
jgi:pimeloyl-ACP methyl ester carboxylesterase